MKPYLSLLLVAVLLTSSVLHAAPRDGRWILVKLGDKPAPKTPTAILILKGNSFSLRGLVNSYNGTFTEGAITSWSSTRKSGKPEQMDFEKSVVEALFGARLEEGKEGEIVFKKDGKTSAVFNWKKSKVVLPPKK